MIFLGPQTTSSLAPTTKGTTCVIFVQARPVCGPAPIKIEGTKDPSSRLKAIAADNASETFLIGMIPTDTPAEAEQRIRAMFAAQHLREGWFSPTTEILSYVQINAQPALSKLLSGLRPHSHPEGTMNVEELAAYLNVSTDTIYRMVKAGKIPYLQAGKKFVFVPGDVVASIKRG